MTGADRRSEFPKNNALNNIVYGSTEQVISITDIISEGPILGLARGGKSVFLNNDSIFEDTEVGYAPVGGETVSGTSGSTSITINEWTAPSYYYDPGVVDTQFILIHDLYSKSSVTHVSTTQTSINTTVGSLPTGVVIIVSYSGADLPTAIEYSGLTGMNQPFFQHIEDGKGWAVITGDEDREISGWVSEVDTANDQVHIYVNRVLGLDYLDWLETADLSLNISLAKGISSISGNGTITLDSALPTSFSNKEFSISAPINNDNPSNPYNRKYDSSGYQFRPGTIDQNPISTLQGVGSSTTTLSVANVNPLNIGNTASIIEANVNSGEIDLVQLNFKYPGGLYLTNTEKGTKEDAGAGYVIELFIQTDTSGNGYAWQSQGFLAGNGTITSDLVSDLSQASTSVSNFAVAGRGIFKHGGKFTSAVNFTHSIDLEPYQPFSGFKLEITRITESENFTDTQTGRGHTYPNLTWRGSDVDKWQAVQAGGIETAFGVIKEKLNFPYTAVANVTFNSKQFPSLPSRTYECYGLKVKVPHNYTTREEAGLNADGSFKDVPDLYNELFNGTFRDDKVYTDNPAWIFYDILTNNRYGIGEFLQEDPATARNVDVDIYSLYRIARYCDELVPDGKGGTEPRFRANLYFQKATDVYKVLKDMATIFRGMLYWMDGKLVPIIDEKKSPVYSFNRSNVVEGLFEYQNTGSKTRANQVIVAWNNPKTDYKLESIIVEDRENIIRTGKIIKENATAFGCTSEGQAVRYGRWKLWTAINQTEIVSFKSAINAAFLAPGDIVTIQDNHDYNYRSSGRVTNVEATTPVVASRRILTLDRNAQSGATGSYPTTSDFLSLLIIDSKVILSQKSALINGVTYTRGDVITAAKDEDGVLISFTGTETEILSKINNVYDDNGNMLSLQYSTESIVHDCDITAVDSSLNKVTVALPYDNAPVSSGSIWGIKDSEESAVSPKEYKILAITRESDNSFGFTAVEYYESKFDAVDNNFTLAIDDPVRPPITPGEKIPAPKNIRVLRTPRFESPGEEIVVVWDPPDSTEEYSNYVTQYEFESNIPGYPDRRLTPSTSYSFTEVPDGSYTFRVKSVTEDGKKSAAVSTEVVIEDIFGGGFDRIYGIIKGGYQSAPAAIVHNVTDEIFEYKFEEDPIYLYSPASRGVTAFPFSSNLPLDYTPLRDDNQTAYVFADYSSSGVVKLINYKFDSDLDIDYWYDQIEQSKINLNAAAAAAGDPEPYGSDNPTIWTQLNGTITIPAGSNKVTGTNTSFTGSSYALTNVLKFEDDNSTEIAAKIAYVESDTVLYIDRVFDEDVTASAFYKDSVSPNFAIDFLMGRLRGASGAYQSFMVLDPDLIKKRELIVDSDVAFIRYDGNEDQVVDGNGDPLYDDITITATGLNYTDPEFKVEGVGFNSTSGTADTTFVSASDGTYSKQVDDASSTIAWSNGQPLRFTVTVREKEDPNNTTKTVTKDYEIVRIKDGAIGLAGKTVVLEADDYSVIYDENSSNPRYNGSTDNDIDLSASFNNFTTPIWKLTQNGSTVAQDWTDTSFSYAYSIPSAYSKSDWPVKFNIQVGEKPSGWSAGTAPDTIEASDSISIAGVREGLGGVAVVNSNNTHAYTTDKNGNIGSGSTGTIPNSGTTLEVLIGGDVGDYIGNTTSYGTSTNDYDMVHKQWYIVASPTNTGGDLQIGAPTGVSSDVVTIGTHTLYNDDGNNNNPTDDTEVITYTIKAKVGIQLVEITTTQSLTKSIAGIDGAATAEMFLLSSSSTEPTTLPEATYTFATGALAATANQSLNSWTATPSSVTATNPYLWKVSKRVIPDADETTVDLGTDTGDLTWDGPVLAASFGDVGEDGRTIVLEPSKHVINYDTAGAETDSITFTATAFGVNSSNTAYYKWYIDGVLEVDGTQQASGHGSDVNSNTFTLPDADEPAIGDSVKVTVELFEGTTAANAVERAQDSVSIYAVQDGQDAIVGFLTNNNHSVTADNDGTNYSLTGAGGDFKVYKGGTELTSGVTFSRSPASSGGLAMAINSSTGVYSLSGTNWTTSAETFTLTATVAAATAGTANDVVITQVYSITKSLKGATGQSITGDDGVPGKRSVQAYIYYQSASSSAPTVPNPLSGTFSVNFNTGAITSSNSNWSTNAPTMTAGNANKYWYFNFIATEAGTYNNGYPDTNMNSSPSPGSNAVQSLGFTGLVTFTSNTATLVSVSDGSQTISFGSQGTTKIDGGNISTGTIQAQRISLNASQVGALSNTTTADQIGGQTPSGTTTQIQQQAVVYSQRYTQITPSGLGVYTTGQTYSTSQAYSTTQANNTFRTSAQVTAAIQAQAPGLAPVQSVNGQTGAVTGIGGDDLSATDVSAGKIVLTSGTLKFTDSTSTAQYQPSNSIVLDTTSGNNSIRIYDGTTERVRLGLL